MITNNRVGDHAKSPVSLPASARLSRHVRHVKSNICNVDNSLLLSPPRPPATNSWLPANARRRQHKGLRHRRQIPPQPSCYVEDLEGIKVVAGTQRRSESRLRSTGNHRTTRRSVNCASSEWLLNSSRSGGDIHRTKLSSDLGRQCSWSRCRQTAGCRRRSSNRCTARHQMKVLNVDPPSFMLSGLRWCAPCESSLPLRCSCLRR